MKPVRPFRAHEVYAAACIDCGEEIEVPTLHVPLRCPGCEQKKEKRDAELGNSLSKLPKKV